MQQLFYQNHYDPKGSFNHSLKLKEVQTAITMHPFKNHTYQYRMHQHMAAVRSMEVRNKHMLLQREVNKLNELLNDRSAQTVRTIGVAPSLNKFHPRERNQVLAWDFLKGRSVYSKAKRNPKRAIESSYRAAIDDMVVQLMMMINKNARQRGRTIDFKEIIYGYRRVDPMHGADYIFDLLLIYRKHKGRRMTVPVRRHAYLQQTFLALEFQEEFPPVIPKLIPTTTPVSSNFLFQIMPKSLSDRFYSTGSQVIDRSAVHDVGALVNKTIHFILPLAGRFQTFLAFMRNFEEVCLVTDERTTLSVMLFHSETDDRTEETIAFISDLQAKYKDNDLRVIQIKGPFSRALALQQGSAQFPPDALLFFIDVDIYLSRDALYRIRTLILQHRQVYFPIVFSQYDPKMLCPSGDEKCDLPGANSTFSFQHDLGYWRQSGFGIAGLYKSDFERIGGFDTTIMGWGKEDVDLFNRILSSSLVIYRATDPSMVHIFHPINCDPSLDPAQYQMCLGTKVATYGSITRLANIVSRTPEIFNRDNGDREPDMKEEEAVAENNQFLVADA